MSGKATPGWWVPLSSPVCSCGWNRGVKSGVFFGRRFFGDAILHKNVN